VFFVMVADGVADGFGGAVEFFGDAAGDVLEAALAAGGEASGHAEDLGFFVVGELFEGGGAGDAFLVVAGESGDGRLEEAQASAAVGVEVAHGDEALFAPALDGFGGDGELFGDIFEEQDAAGAGGTFGEGVFDPDMEGVGEEFDEGGEVGAEDFAGEGVVGVFAGVEAGDAEVDEVPGVGFGGVDGGEEFGGGAELLAALVGRGVGELGGQLEEFVVAPCRQGGTG
jgi:hypothetical protein